MADGLDDLLGSAPAAPVAPVSQPSAPLLAPAPAAGGDGLNDLLGSSPTAAPTLPAAPKPDNSFWNWAATQGQAFGANMPRGFLEIPEQAGNLSNFAYRNAPEAIASTMDRYLPHPALSPAEQQAVDRQMATGIRDLWSVNPLGNMQFGVDYYTQGLNRLLGRDSEAPIDVAGPAGNLFGADQLNQKAPIAGALGGIAGAMAMPIPGGAPSKATEGLWQAAREGLSHGAVSGGLYGALSEAGDEAKQGQLDPWKIGQAGAVGVGLGAPLGAVLHGGVSAFSRGFKPQPQITPESHRIEQKLYTPGPREQGHISSLVEQHGQPPPVPPAPRITPQHPAGAPGKVVRIGHEPTGWRQERIERSRPATPEEHKLLRDISVTKVALDKVTARLSGAVEQIMKELRVQPNGRPTLSPEQQAELEQIRKSLGGKPVNTKYFREAALQKPIASGYKFKSEGLRGKLAEVRNLRRHQLKLQAAYDKARVSENLEGLPKDETIERNVLGHKVLVTNRTNVRNYEFPTETDKATYQSARSRLLAQAPRDQKFTGEALLKAVEADPAVNAELERYGLKEWLNEIAMGKRGHALSDPLGIVGIVNTVNATTKLLKANAGINVNAAETLAKVLKHIKDNGLDKELTPRLISRLVGVQTTHDAIAQYRPDIAYKRAAYLATREAVASGGRELRPQERELLNAMTSNEIRSSSKLQGWTALERKKEADAKALDDQYAKYIKGEIEKIQHANKGLGVAGFARLARMLEMDLQDLGKLPRSEPPLGVGRAGSVIADKANKLTNGLFSSTFKGNYGVHNKHLAEGVMANIAHPLALKQAAQRLVHSQTARDFAGMVAGKGMMQQMMEGDKFALSAWVDRHVNNPLQHKIESLNVGGKNVGKLLHRTISGELPERLKTQATALIAAERAAKDYPNGTEQFMKDWLATSKGGQIPAARQHAFEKASVDFFIARNKAIMYMPEGPLKERTMFSRHGALKPMFPFLRSITQQTRVLSGFVDDGIEAVSKGDRKGAAAAAARIVAATTFLSFTSGHYAIPEPVREFMEQVDPEHSEKLFALMEEARKHNLAFGRRDEELGPKMVPAWSGGNLFVGSTASNVLDTARSFGNPEKPPGWKAGVRAAAQILSMSVIDNIGHVEGLNNLSKFFGKMYDASQGESRLFVPQKTNVIQKADDFVHGRRRQPLYSGTTESDIGRGLGDWFYNAQRPEDTDTIDWAQHLPADQE